MKKNNPCMVVLGAPEGGSADLSFDPLTRLPTQQMLTNTLTKKLEAERREKEAVEARLQIETSQAWLPSICFAVGLVLLCSRFNRPDACMDGYETHPPRRTEGGDGAGTARGRRAHHAA